MAVLQPERVALVPKGLQIQESCNCLHCLLHRALPRRTAYLYGIRFSALLCHVAARSEVWFLKALWHLMRRQL